MIDHITVKVNDLTQSKKFYEKVFLPFGYRLSFGKEEDFWAFDVGSGALFEISQNNNTNLQTPCHVAFRASTIEVVKLFHNAALAAGGQCNGPPGKRPQYTENYYAAFVIDPSGHNIEAVFDLHENSAQ